MEKLFDVLSSFDRYELSADVPRLPEYEGIRQYLEEWDFIFAPSEYMLRSISLSGIFESEYINKIKKSNYVIPLKEVAGTRYKQLIAQLYDMTKTAGEETTDIIDGIADDNDKIDKDMSCAYVKDDELKGIFIVRRYPSGNIVPVAARWFSDKEQPEILPMLHHVIERMDKGSKISVFNYHGQEKKIYMLLKHLFPTENQLPMDHGVFRPPLRIGEQSDTDRLRRGSRDEIKEIDTDRSQPGQQR